jgi:hypothetical protein
MAQAGRTTTTTSPRMAASSAGMGWSAGLQRISEEPGLVRRGHARDAVLATTRSACAGARAPGRNGLNGSLTEAHRSQFRAELRENGFEPVLAADDRPP